MQSEAEADARADGVANLLRGEGAPRQRRYARFMPATRGAEIAQDLAHREAEAMACNLRRAEHRRRNDMPATKDSRGEMSP